MRIKGRSLGAILRPADSKLLGCVCVYFSWYFWLPKCLATSLQRHLIRYITCSVCTTVYTRIYSVAFNRVGPLLNLILRQSHQALTIRHTK